VESAAPAAAEAPSGIAALGLNVKLFAAQLINFAVVLFVLWKWVFTPVAKNLEARTKRIENSLADAQNIDKQKIEFSQWKDKEMAEARKQAAEIIAKSEKETTAIKQKALDQTKLEQEHLITQAKQQIGQEKDQSLKDIKSEVADMVTNAAEKILKQKLDGKQDEKLIHDYLKPLE
jgi:F-type H+-transporting ATPase subunit b